MDDSKDTKEELDMGTISKPQEAIVVTKGMTQAFIDLLDSKKIAKSYWEECLSANKDLSDDEAEILKRMCNGDN